MNIDLNLIRGILTAVLLFSFIGLWIWAWSRKQVTAFQEAANLPFADDMISQHSGVAETKNIGDKTTKNDTGEQSI
jgi:cytochrome c oxidase cbb3-type subunit 4